MFIIVLNKYVTSLVIFRHFKMEMLHIIYCKHQPIDIDFSLLTLAFSLKHCFAKVQPHGYGL